MVASSGKLVFTRTTEVFFHQNPRLPHLLQENEAVADTVASSNVSTSLSPHVRRQLSVSLETIAEHRRTTFLVS